MKSIDNINDKGLYHGYQEWYSNGGILWFRGNYKNDQEIGYQEWNPRSEIGEYGTEFHFYVK